MTLRFREFEKRWHSSSLFVDLSKKKNFNDNGGKRTGKPTELGCYAGKRGRCQKHWGVTVLVGGRGGRLDWWSTWGKRWVRPIMTKQGKTDRQSSKKKE